MIVSSVRIEIFWIAGQDLENIENDDVSDVLKVYKVGNTSEDEDSNSKKLFTIWKFNEEGGTYIKV